MLPIIRYDDSWSDYDIAMDYYADNGEDQTIAYVMHRYLKLIKELEFYRETEFLG